MDAAPRITVFHLTTIFIWKVNDDNGEAQTRYHSVSFLLSY